MKKLLSCIVIFSLFQNGISAQDKGLLTEKQGTYKIKYGTLNGQGPDQYGKSCGYTKAEADEAIQTLLATIDIFRKLPVLKDNKGFDGYCYLNGGRCNTKFGYGLPSTICFFFESWKLQKGKEVKQTSEPPQWRFEVNMTEKFCNTDSMYRITATHIIRPIPLSAKKARIKVPLHCANCFFCPE